MPKRPKNQTRHSISLSAVAYATLERLATLRDKNLTRTLEAIVLAEARQVDVAIPTREEALVVLARRAKPAPKNDHPGSHFTF